jgi:hypothetical protein
MINWKGYEKDMKGSVHALIEILSWHVLGRTEGKPQK